jgi:hypothetical protein
MQPSAQPSSQPTNPTSQPSSQPSFNPTSSVPTTAPSSPPSKSPSTTHPSNKGATNRPTNNPSSGPTYDLQYKTDLTYLQYLKRVDASLKIPNSFTFGTFFFKGHFFEGKCDAWKSFTDNSLNLPFDDVYYSQISTYVEYYDFDTRISKRSVVTCANKVYAYQIILKLIAGGQGQWNCGEVQWRVFQCNGRNVLCVNCKRTCEPSATGASRSFVVNPCLSSSYHASAAAVLSVQYYLVKLYPEFLPHTQVLYVL